MPAVTLPTTKFITFSLRLIHHHHLPQKSPFRRLTSAGLTPSFCRASATKAQPESADAMVKAIRVHEVGGPEVLKWEDVEVGEPGDGEVRVRNEAIGLNFIDVYFRKGVYKAAILPFTPGMEAVGVVVAVGPGLTGRRVRDVIAYVEEQIPPADRVVTVSFD